MDGDEDIQITLEAGEDDVNFDGDDTPRRTVSSKSSDAKTTKGRGGSKKKSAMDSMEKRYSGRSGVFERLGGRDTDKNGSITALKPAKCALSFDLTHSHLLECYHCLF